MKLACVTSHIAWRWSTVTVTLLKSRTLLLVKLGLIEFRLLTKALGFADVHLSLFHSYRQQRRQVLLAASSKGCRFSVLSPLLVPTTTYITKTFLQDTQPSQTPSNQDYSAAERYLYYASFRIYRRSCGHNVTNSD